MIDWSYSHFRVFMRMLAPNSLVYTEMQTTGAIQNNPAKALHYNPIEHSVAMQLGGSDPLALAQSAGAAAEAGYDEINLNLGCPSHKVQSGQFGACMMREPKLAAACIKAIKRAVHVPVSAKTRIGVDHEDSYEYFRSFACHLIDAGVDKLIVHARKAWLTGLNPKQNRTIPPLHYEYVYDIKKEFPNLSVVINGNITESAAVIKHLKQVDGIMIGRLACDNPYQVALIHSQLYPKVALASRSEIFKQYLDYAHGQWQKGVPLSLLVKPVFNLVHGLSGSSVWKKKIMTLLQTKHMDHWYELAHFLLEIEA